MRPVILREAEGSAYSRPEYFEEPSSLSKNSIGMLNMRQQRNPQGIKPSVISAHSRQEPCTWCAAACAVICVRWSVEAYRFMFAD
jgi:hypothetical protein